MFKLSYWKENWTRNLTLLLSLTVLFFIVLLAFFSWRWADDFCYFNRLRNQNVWQFAWSLYNHWDGRGLMQGVFWGFMLKYLPTVIMNMIWTATFIGSAFFIYKILIVEAPFLNKDKFNLSIQVAAIAVVLWLGMKSHISETVYWSTGGYYILSTFFGLIWSYLIIKSAKDISKLNLWEICFFIFSILVGMFSHNLSTGLLALGFITAIIIWLRNGLRASGFKRVASDSLGILIGTIIISIAPGNFVRSLAGPRSFQINIGVLFNNYISTLKYYLDLSGYLIIFSILVALLLTFLIRKKFKLKKELVIDFSKKVIIPFDRNLLTNVLERTKYLFAGFATILPMIFLPDFLVPRTSIFFMVFTLIFILISFTTIFRKILYDPEPNEENCIKKSPKFAYVFLCAIFLLQLSIVVPHNIQAYEIKKKILARDNFLGEKQNRGSDVVVNPLNIPSVPFSLRFNDISSDPTNWVNVCVAGFYDFKSIKISE